MFSFAHSAGENMRRKMCIFAQSKCKVFRQGVNSPYHGGSSSCDLGHQSLWAQGHSAFMHLAPYAQ